ncbi:Rad17 cell cycle checkpoint protein [Gregarina niphandrodes]|uniref:Rad17 cell cycle checkpoint protein n=1 Tax=Gregarina niphandrodes TaxID=110365 RepID=A0A023B772_GRENI|nr:Rad17 cell cycle checkpoint protein [Gregarina niphandrodes]EZG66987.1 Rad17 cell cycle checkpoint protein [Gregarina niphandrodes]|eukprot:XP_011130374.1 Rad17 cell cycle checkpoint protein [Gregarina niphandrodes]
MESVTKSGIKSVTTSVTKSKAKAERSSGRAVVAGPRTPQRWQDLAHGRPVLERVRESLERCRLSDEFRLLVVKGSSGCGKSLAVRLLCEELVIPVVEVNLYNSYHELLDETTGLLGSTDSASAGSTVDRIAMALARYRVKAAEVLSRSEHRVALWLRGLSTEIHTGGHRTYREALLKGLEMLQPDKRLFVIILVTLGRNSESNDANWIQTQLTGSGIGCDVILFPEPSQQMVQRVAKYTYNNQVSKEDVEKVYLETDKGDIRQVLRKLDYHLFRRAAGEGQGLSVGEEGKTDSWIHPSHLVAKFIRAKRIPADLLADRRLVTKEEYRTMVEGYRQASLVLRHRRCLRVPPHLAVWHTSFSTAPVFPWKLGTWYVELNDLKAEEYLEEVLQDLRTIPSGITPPLEGTPELGGGLDDLFDRTSRHRGVAGILPVPLRAVCLWNLKRTPGLKLLTELEGKPQGSDLLGGGSRDIGRPRDPVRSGHLVGAVDPSLRVGRGSLWEEANETLRVLPDQQYGVLLDLMVSQVPHFYTSLEDCAKLYESFAQVDVWYNRVWDDLSERCYVLALAGGVLMTEPVGAAQRRFGGLSNAFTNINQRHLDASATATRQSLPRSKMKADGMYPDRMYPGGMYPDGMFVSNAAVTKTTTAKQSVLEFKPALAPVLTLCCDDIEDLT